MAIFPLAPDQTIAQMWSNGVRARFYRFIFDKLSVFLTSQACLWQVQCVLKRQCFPFLSTRRTCW